jgi:hypothetical protein
VFINLVGKETRSFGGLLERIDVGQGIQYLFQRPLDILRPGSRGAGNARGEDE